MSDLVSKKEKENPTPSPGAQGDGRRREAVSIKPIFAWYDLWVGAFWDAAKRRLYIFPVPCLGLLVQFAPKERP